MDIQVSDIPNCYVRIKEIPPVKLSAEGRNVGPNQLRQVILEALTPRQPDLLYILYPFSEEATALIRFRDIDDASM